MLAAVGPGVIPPANLRALKAGDGPSREPEGVVIMGVQGAGKSTLVNRYTDAGYERLKLDATSRVTSSASATVS